MFPESTVAKGTAAIVSFLLLILPPAIFADETYDATLMAVEHIDTGLYTHRVSVQVGNRVERLLVNEHAHLNNLNIRTSDGSSLEQTGIAYSGIVESQPSSWARLMIDGDFISGTINSQGERHHLSSGIARKTFAQPSGRDSILLPPIQSNGRQALAFERALADELDQFEEIQFPVTGELIDRNGEVTRVANIGLVIDSSYIEATGGQGVNRAIGVINSVDGIYREKFGLALNVDVILVITDNTTLNLKGITLKDNLDLFRDYRMSTDRLPADLSLVHLFTGSNPIQDDDSVGLAYKGSACRTDGYDVSMSRPFQFAVILAAHEIGHNLGATHDDETTECVDINDHLMFSVINPTTTQEFSSCSVTDINTRLSQSTCFASAIDIDLHVAQVESNQILATVTNTDSARAFPSATLTVNLKNASIAAAPASCELEDPSKLICTIPATYAGDTQDVAVKLRLDPDKERTINVHLEPVGFFDLNQTNDDVEIIIPGVPQPLAGTGDVTVQSTGGTAVANDSTPSDETSFEGGSSGGGKLEPLLLWLLLSSVIYKYSLIRKKLI